MSTSENPTPIAATGIETASSKTVRSPLKLRGATPKHPVVERAREQREQIRPATRRRAYAREGDRGGHERDQARGPRRSPTPRHRRRGRDRHHVDRTRMP